MAKRIDILCIDTVAELERLEVQYEHTDNYEIKICCPSCGEKNPSCQVNTQKNLWNCKSAACTAKGDIIALLSLLMGKDRADTVEELASRYSGLIQRRVINQKVVERYHKEIWNQKQALKELRKRGIEENAIRRARLGFDVDLGRITIPVYTKDRQVINVRKYMPGAPGHMKMKNTPGYGKTFIYQEAELEYDKVWICGGELKALVVSILMNKHGIGAIAPTAGEGNWSDAFSLLLKDKDVYICYDVDDAGKLASVRIAKAIYMFAKSVRIVRLPLDRKKYPKGDVNDYVGQERATDENLAKLMIETKPWIPPMAESNGDETVLNTTLNRAVNAKEIGKRIKFEAVVSSMDTIPYMVPRRVRVECDRNQPNCYECPVKVAPLDTETNTTLVRMHKSSSGILNIINTPKSKQLQALKDALRIPSCKSCSFHSEDFYSAVEVTLAPQIEFDSDSSANITQPGFCITDSEQQLAMNTVYEMTGRIHPHPQNQQAVMLVDDSKEGIDNLSSFNPTEAELEQLKVFQASDSISDKLHEIYKDLETNVTRIYKRGAVHLAMDMTFHSVPLFCLDGREIPGWMNMLLIGDSAQGKTDIADYLRKHYKLGERVDCKNASVAGLVGGLQQVGQRWFIQWGIIPTHDRRLVVLEEIKGADPEVLTKLTDMRSSGIAAIPKIKSGKAFARTRLIMISNPKFGRDVGSFNFGIDIITGLFSELEDIRRFDLAMIISQNQVSADEINKLAKNRPKVKHVYTSKLCQRLVLWAWTRKISDIQFQEGVAEHIVEKALELCSIYSESVPLIDKGTTKYKLARMSCALAARLYSTTNGKNLVVTKKHVEHVTKFIDDVYSNRTVGYRNFSEAVEYANNLKDENAVKTRIVSQQYGMDLIDQLLHADTVTVEDIQDWTELDKEQARGLLSFFVRMHALHRQKRMYVKSSQFVSLLKRMQKDEMIVKHFSKPTTEREEF